MNNEQSKIQYQGQAYDVVMFDELTHFTYDEYIYLFSRCRPNGAGTRCYVRSTANPGNVGHGWVKERFITAGKPDNTIWEDVTWTEPSGEVKTQKMSRIFVPSSVFDNKALLDNDPMYVQRLASMPEAERNALLYGDWDSFSGQVFREWKNDSTHYIDRHWTHVIEPFRVPSDWSIWCGLDWGYSKPYSVGWYAVEPKTNIMYRIKELYGCNGNPNTGVLEEPTEVARQIKAIEEQDINLKGRVIHRVGDPAIWGSQTGESIGTLFEKERVYWDKGNHARIDGKMQFHYRLAFSEEGIPKFYCFNTCKHFIRTVPNLVYSEKHVEDIDTDGEDHIYDECRYVMMENPIAMTPRPAPIERPYNPLDTSDDISNRTYDRYDYFRRL